MKAIVTYTDSLQRRHTATVCDSALLRSHEPFFMPDGGSWMALPLRGVRIDRLGKAIQARFATRYYNYCLTAVHPYRDDNHDPLPWLRDGALTLSAEAPADGLDPAFAAEIDSLIESYSTVATLKTGDIILTANTADAIPIRHTAADYDISALFGCPPLKYKVR